MGKLITNKDKQKVLSDHGEKPNKYMKKWTTKKLRIGQNDIIEDQLSAKTPAKPGKDRFAARKKTGVCPVCLSKLHKNAKKTRYERCCKSCGAVLQSKRICPNCSTSRVWLGRSGAVCKGCGKEQNT